MSKPRFDSVLFQLSPERQAQVFDWVARHGYLETAKKITAPEPEGFGLVTHATSVRRFYLRYLEKLESEELTEKPVDSAIEDAARSVVYQLATQPADPNTFQQVSRWITKHKYAKIAEEHLDLARKRLALDREHMELNAARLALKYYTKLKEIDQSPQGDCEDKVRAARDLIFGKNSTQPTHHHIHEGE